MKNAIRLRWTEKTCMGGYSSFRSFSNAEIDFNVTKFHKSWNCEKLSPKESNLHTAAVCRVSKHFGENDTGQRKLRWNKEVWQQETNSVFFVVSEKKSILGRYINTLFFITKDTNDSLILRMWCLCFFFFRGKNLPDTNIMWNLCRCRSIGIHACHVISGTELALVGTNLLSLEI